MPKLPTSRFQMNEGISVDVINYYCWYDRICNLFGCRAASKDLHKGKTYSRITNEYRRWYTHRRSRRVKCFEHFWWANQKWTRRDNWMNVQFGRLYKIKYLINFIPKNILTNFIPIWAWVRTISTSFLRCNFPQSMAIVSRSTLN